MVSIPAAQGQDVSTHTLLVRGTRYPPSRPQLKNSRPIITRSSLSDAQVVMVRDRKFPRERRCLLSLGRSVEVNARQREFEAGGRHWNEELERKVEHRLSGSTFDV
jgi:hypothetical protein